MHRLLLVTTLAALAFADIPPSVMAESNLEKRSELALKVADDAITAAAKAYATAATDLNSFQQHLTSVEELTRVSIKSLNDTGKRASKSPKYFKRAELKLRSLIRRMSSLSDEVSIDDRPRVEAVKKVMSEAHEQLLHDIMSKR